MLTGELSEKLNNGELDKRICDVYGDNSLEEQKVRFSELLKIYNEIFYKDFEAGDVHLFSAPGRCEICGNHTDHQNGCVIAAAVNLDMAAAVSKNESNIIRIFSVGYGMCEVELSKVESCKAEKLKTESCKAEKLKAESLESENSINKKCEKSKTSGSCSGTEAIIRGMAESLKKAGFKVSGFNACVKSDIPEGAGVSSSAALEILIGSIISGLFNEGTIDPVQLAFAAKRTENEYFGKPSGLLDQLSIAEGGLCFMDFKNPKEPLVERIEVDLNSLGYLICLVDTGSSHADLTYAYAEIPADMKAVAAHFGKAVLREVEEEEFKLNSETLIEKYGERAFKRAVHFFNEQRRVAELKECFANLCDSKKISENLNISEKIVNPEIEKILKLLTNSGKSSFNDLKNVCLPGEEATSSMVKALKQSEEILKDIGAYRVHGGGFAGTVMAIVPDELVDEYTYAVENVFGKGSVKKLNIRKYGGYKIC